jgi:hypothetical protein
MADPKYIPAAPELAELHGGRTRPSVELDLSDYPAVKLRNDLNARLLDTTCPFGTQQPERQFTLDDLDLLVLVTAERFGGEGALLRRQAVVALGTLDSDRAIERLVELAISPVETDAVRVAAVGALRPGAVESLREQLDEDPSETVRDYVRWRLGGERPERRKTPGQPPEEARRS